MKAFQLTEKMHSCGIAADCDLCARGLKAQMKYADKIGAQYSICLLYTSLCGKRRGNAGDFRRCRSS